jgi:hypothetical protein
VGSGIGVAEELGSVAAAPDVSSTASPPASSDWTSTSAAQFEP